jgi:hypothetical protein
MRFGGSGSVCDHAAVESIPATKWMTAISLAFMA